MPFDPSSAGLPGPAWTPPDGIHQPNRPQPRVRSAVRVLRNRWVRLGIGALALFVGVCGVLTAYAELTLPPLSDIGRATGTIRIFDRQGRLIAEIGHDARLRHTVPLSQVSPWLVKATIATEDRGFYDEGAINAGRIAKALVVDVLAGRPAQGASTITQQLAKLAFLSNDKSALRKLREALLASEIDRAYSKKEILEKYLNLIDYGAGAVGVQDAAQRYFGKDAVALDLRESTLLAGLPKAPSTFNPYENSQLALDRMHVVVGALVDTHVISAGDAAGIDPRDSNPARARTNTQAIQADLRNGHPLGFGVAPHFTEYVREHLERLAGQSSLMTTGSLDVTTTLDLDLQQRAQQAVSTGVTAIGRGANDGAMLMLDAHSGDILAMVGSANFDDAAIDGQFNVTTGLRRPGSSFKPFVYATAFNEGRLSPTSTLDDTAAESARLGGVQDYDRAYLGRITAAQALVQSRNVAAEQAMALAGIQNVIAVARSLGITTEIAGNLTSAIGTSAVRMTEHAAAFAGLADGGTAVSPRAILRIVDSDGNRLFEARPAATGPRVVQRSAADGVSRILRGQPPATGLAFRYDVAGKSGTTDNFVDAWYAAYTPDWVVDAWVGHTGQPQEVGMNGVGGQDTGAQVVVPFVNALPPPRAFDDSGAARCPDGSTVSVGVPTCPSRGDTGNGNSNGD
jgi:penicillin-binding protein 2D